MKELKLKITINKPAAEVFAFTLNPENTPKWIDFIKEEETNEWPVKLGTIYRNTDGKGEWDEYELTEYDPPRAFTLSRRGPRYHVRYLLTDHGSSSELEYYEWVDSGEITVPFTMEPLEKLKRIIEA